MTIRPVVSSALDDWPSDNGCPRIQLRLTKSTCPRYAFARLRQVRLLSLTIVAGLPAKSYPRDAREDERGRQRRVEIKECPG